MKKTWLFLLAFGLIVCLVLGIFFGKQSPKLELETETETATEESTPAFGEQTETEDKKTEENKTEENKVSFTASPANPYFGTELYAAALNTQKMQEGKLQHLPVFKMESREEMNSFYTSFGQSLSRGSDRADFESFESVKNRLDDTFFEENALFVVYVTPDSGSYRYGVDQLLTSEKEMTISVCQTNRPQAVTMDLVGWLISVEVPKKDLAGISEFDATLTRPAS